MAIMGKKITVIGNLGQKTKPNGQTVRTKTVWETIEKYYSDDFDTIFIDAGGSKIVKLFLRWRLLSTSSIIVIMPGPRSINMVTHLLHFLGVSKRVIHVAIGGWLPDYIENNRALLKREKSFHAVLVQMDSIRETLQIMGLDNVVWFPNYRNTSRINIPVKVPEKAPDKFVFYSRVVREKGVFTAVDAIKRLTDEGKDVLLDIYGPIDAPVRQELEKEIAGYSNIHYCGVLFGEEILQTLSQYDCMLFPTCYRGEGFPGAVLESMLAGVPAIATDWKYNSEIVKDGMTGIICGPQTTDSVYDSIQRIRTDITLYRCISEGAYYEAEKYTGKAVTPILLDIIDEIKCRS